MYIAAIAVMGIAAGCGKAKNLADINVDIPYSKEVTIPPVAGYSYTVPLPTGGVALPFPALPIPTNSKQYVDQYKTSLDKLVKVDLKTLGIDVVSPAGLNFDFLDTVRLYISADNEQERLVAYQYGVPKGTTTLNLTTMTDVNLKNYFIKETMYFRMDAHINAVPPPGATLNIRSVLHILANPLE